MKSSLRRVLGMVVCAVLGTATAVCLGADSAAAAAAPCNGTTPGGDVVVFCLWENYNYTGEEIKIGPRWEEPDLQNVPGPGVGNVWNDAISSVQVNPAYQDLFALTLYRDDNFGGPTDVVTVPGNLTSFNDKTSSYAVVQTNYSRTFPVPTCTGSEVFACVWSGYNYTGAELQLTLNLRGDDILTDYPIPSAFYTVDSRTWNDQISSIQFNGAVGCPPPKPTVNFDVSTTVSGDNPVTLTGNVPIPTLRGSGLDNTISSIDLWAWCSA